MSSKKAEILERLDRLSHQELKQYLAEELTRKRLGLSWEADLIERDRAINSNTVLPKIDLEISRLSDQSVGENLIIEGDNFDSLRLLNATHRGRIRVIYIDPPYNTGNKDWVYQDDFVKKNDRWKHSKWLEFLYQRLVLARDLLTPDGVILVSINDENRAKLEMLMDEAMPGRRIGSFVWRSRSGGNDTKGAFLSDNHEHVLVYGNPNFRFDGTEKTYSMYRYEDSVGPFRLSDLTKAHNKEQRPNTYYPIYDPSTDIYYPGNPSRVWAYSSKYRVATKQKLRGKTIEEMIKNHLVWFPESQKVVLYKTMAELLAAIDIEDVPKSSKTLLITRDMEDLSFWINKKIGFGRPALKKYKDALKNPTQPISSWLTPSQEKGTIDPSKNMPVVGTTEEGSKRLSDLIGGRQFPFPKPPSLIESLISQASNGNDIILDFFAGSGTTGEVALRLNQLDQGNRRFILCSNTEASHKEDSKNVCRDICATRISAVIDELKNEDGLIRGFGYLTMDLVEEADLMFESTPEHAFNLISLRETGAVRLPPEGSPIWEVVRLGQRSAIVLCPVVNAAAIQALKDLGLANLVVYSVRPSAIEDALEGVCEVDSRNLNEALRYAQIDHAVSKSSTSTGEDV